MYLNIGKYAYTAHLAMYSDTANGIRANFCSESVVVVDENHREGSRQVLVVRWKPTTCGVVEKGHLDNR